jgi:signal transduction histidine kinase
MIKFLKRRTLFRRLLAIELAAVTVVCVGLSLYAYSIVNDKENGVADSDLRMVSGALARLASILDDTEHSRAIAEQIREILVEHTEGVNIKNNEFSYQLWRSNGELMLASTEVPPMPRIPPGTIATKQRVEYEHWVVMARPSPDGKILAVIGYSQDFFSRLDRQILLQTLQTYLISMAVLTVALWLAVRYGLRPLRGLASTLNSRRHDDFSALTPPREYVETQSMVAALNDKIQRIGSMVETERAFFADAAHELRTPLAVLSAQAHLVAIEKDAGQRAEALAELEAGVARAAQVLNKLLTMAKYHGAENRAVLVETDLVQLVSDIVAEHAPRAIEANQELALDAPVRAHCLCDAMAMRIAIDNLVDNAIRYSPPGGQILIRVQEKADSVCISVADEGPGVAVADRGRIFERFERLDNSVTTGSGLGLAIVKRIVELHNGTISVSEGLSNRGTQFEISLSRKLFDLILPARSQQSTSPTSV